MLDAVLGELTLLMMSATEIVSFFFIFIFVSYYIYMDIYMDIYGCYDYYSRLV